MRNTAIKVNISKKVLYLTKSLPYFGISYLKSIVKNDKYLKIILYRHSKNGEIIRIKKGIYTTKDYIDKIRNDREISNYLEFLAGVIYAPAYLSLEYVLYENNLLTESPANFTLITKNKTLKLKNKFGNFIYHTVKDDLFCGFNTVRHNDFIIYKASKAKALFDFLYLRKNLIVNLDFFNELRLNLIVLNVADKKEFFKYVKIEGSKKMLAIYKYIIT